MLKPIFYSAIFVCTLNSTSTDAKKRSLYDSRLKVDPQLEALWYADDEGNEITEDSDYVVSVGAKLQMVIQANKDADGELATIDMEEEACTYRLISDTYELKNGFIDDIVLNGDSVDPKNPDRALNNLTRLHFIGIEETRQCLEAYKEEVKYREKNSWCEKKSWPFRTSNSSKVQRCR